MLQCRRARPGSPSSRGLGARARRLLRLRRGHEPGAGARRHARLRRAPRPQGDAGECRAHRRRDPGARPGGALLQRERGGPRASRRGRGRDGARPRRPGRGGRAAGPPPRARLRHAHPLHRRPDQGRRHPGADGHDARRDGAQPRVLDPGGRGPGAHDARRPRLRDDVVGEHARPARLRAGVRGEGCARGAHPPARRGARAARDRRERDPRRRDGYAGAPEDPGSRSDHRRRPAAQPERAPDNAGGRRASHRHARPSRDLLDHRERHRRRRRRRNRRVTYLQGVVLGVVQGLTEFLPVSSSGHLILVPIVFGWPDQGLAFDAVMHLGTLAALLAYFRRELVALVTGELSRGLGARILVATVPGALVGVALGKLIEAHLRSPGVIALSTGAWALVMWVADRRAVRAPDGAGDPLERIGWGQGIVIGCAQAVALIPGTSRSGITITVGLLTGGDRATAPRFAVLLRIPITAGAGGLKALHLAKTGLPPGELGPLLAALLAAFLSGWCAVWFLVGYLRTRSLRPFVIYRLLLALAIFLVVLRG